MNQHYLISKAIILAFLILVITEAVYSQSGQKWATGGNPASLGDFLGTTNNFPLVFKTSNIERFRITETGNFGIGLSNPTNKFEVSGNSLFNGDMNIIGKLIITDTVSSNTPNIEVTILKTDRILPIDSAIHFGDSSVVLNLKYNSISWSNTSTPQPNSVPVGGLAIGNPYPAQSQYFPVGYGLNSIAIGYSTTYTYGFGSIAMGKNIYTNVNSINSVTIGSGVGHHTSPLVNNKPNCLMVGFNSDIPTLFVGSSNGVSTTGNVGIGTAEPGFKLDVYAGATNGFRVITQHGISQWGYCIKAEIDNDDTKAIVVEKAGVENFKVYGNGVVYAREITVTLDNFPDYVFDEKYKLLNLNELEGFIKTNKHLPGIPKGLDIIDNGLNIGEMQNLQMQKIEELTLYIIELNKRLEILEQENIELKTEKK